jgi:hypothetical protein
MDSRYPRYLRVRVEYPLEKPLQPNMMVKIKGRGQLSIILHYENVLFFCFSCCRIGHSVMNCVHDDTSGREVQYGEELRASPAKRVKEIAIRPQDARVARSFFQLPGNSFGT